MICKFSTRWGRGSERSGELVVQLYPMRGHLGGSTVVYIWLFKQCASFNSCQFLGKLQLHFRCIYSTCPNHFPSSKECHLILFFCLYCFLPSSSWLYVSKRPFQVTCLIAYYRLSKQKIQFDQSFNVPLVRISGSIWMWISGSPALAAQFASWEAWIKKRLKVGCFCLEPHCWSSLRRKQKTKPSQFQKLFRAEFRWGRWYRNTFCYSYAFI